jgi:hypothetical protein
MDAVLTLESAEAVRLAAKLAEPTHSSLPDAVTRALRDEIARECEIQRRTAEILAIAAEIRSRMSDPLPSSDQSWLYGGDGLPA